MLGSSSTSKTLGILFDSGGRYLYNEPGKFAFSAVERDSPAIFLNDPKRQAQTQAGTSILSPRCEKWVELPIEILLGDANTIVQELDLHEDLIVLPCFACGNLEQLLGTSLFSEGIPRIADHINDN